MYKILSIFVALVCAFMFTGTVSAAQSEQSAKPQVVQQKKAKSSSKTFIMWGKVASIDIAANQISIELTLGKKAAPNSTIYNVNATTNIMKAGQVITLSKIAAGDQVTIAFKRIGDKRVAEAITVKNAKNK